MNPECKIVDYYKPSVSSDPPDALLGQGAKVGDEESAAAWLDRELQRLFPRAEALIQKMQLEVRYKDVTFETLNEDDFLEAIQSAFPQVDWEKAYNEFRAVGEDAKNDEK